MIETVNFDDLIKDPETISVVEELMPTATLEKKGLAYNGNSPNYITLKPGAEQEIYAPYSLIILSNSYSGRVFVGIVTPPAIYVIHNGDDKFSTEDIPSKMCIILKDTNHIRLKNNTDISRTFGVNVILSAK